MEAKRLTRRAVVGGGCLAALAATPGIAGAQDGVPGLVHWPLGALTPQDAVELLTAHLDIHKADVEEGDARLRGATQRVERLAAGAVPGSQLADARSEVDVLKAQLKVRQAEQRVAEVMLRQAQRRLNRPQERPRP